MGKVLIIKGANFLANAVDSTDTTYLGTVTVQSPAIVNTLITNGGKTQTQNGSYTHQISLPSGTKRINITSLTGGKCPKFVNCFNSSTLPTAINDASWLGYSGIAGAGTTGMYVRPTVYNLDASNDDYYKSYNRDASLGNKDIILQNGTTYIVFYAGASNDLISSINIKCYSE